MCADEAGPIESRSIETWARNYIDSTDLDHKLAPPTPPTVWQQPTPAPLRRTAAGRPPELTVVARAPRSPSRTQMGTPRRRAQLLHTFLHHELQAAELMCWAILAFPDTPRAFRQGLLGICQDEIRHMGLYRRHLVALGHDVGDFPVRDWFWQRVASCERPVQFVALMGMGLEAGNLDHTKRYEEWFREAGDHDGAALQQLVGEEEVAHVQFGCHWFRQWTGDDDFEDWRQALVLPLTPSMMKGNELDRERRSRAGFSAEFLRQLESWQPT